MCPFDHIADLNTVRLEIIGRWHEEQRLREQLETTELRERALLEQLAQLEQRLRELQAKPKGASGKGKKNSSERRKRNGHTTTPPKKNEEQTGHGPTPQPALDKRVTNRVYG